jgi:hypothetical protein
VGLCAGRVPSDDRRFSLSLRLARREDRAGEGGLEEVERGVPPSVVGSRAVSK